MHGGRVWNEYDGRAQLIHWTPNQVKEWWDLQSSQVHKSDEIFNQVKYTRELIKKFGLEDVKISKSPMITTTKLDKDEQGTNIDINLYRSMIDSLLYLMANRPDIIFSVCLCARFQSCPKESHLIAGY